MPTGRGYSVICRIAAAQPRRPRPQLPVRELYLVDSNLNIAVDIIVVQSQNKIDYEGETMLDGRPVRLITAYCVGCIDCPEAVNTVS